MTPSQLEPSAHAPCSSTMVGLGPPPLVAAAVAAPAAAIWLAETSSPATARTTAIRTIRILERRMLWMMFTAVLPFLLLREPSARRVRVRVRGIPSRRPGVQTRSAPRHDVQVDVGAERRGCVRAARAIAEVGGLDLAAAMDCE